MPDTEIERELRENMDDLTLKLRAIKEQKEVINEYRGKHEQIQKAAAQFGMYLKKYSITPYNDVKIAYHEFLVKEGAKVEVGGKSKKLDALNEDLLNFSA